MGKVLAYFEHQRINQIKKFGSMQYCKQYWKDRFYTDMLIEALLASNFFSVLAKTVYKEAIKNDTTRMY